MSILKKIYQYLRLVRLVVCLSVFLMSMLGYWLTVHRFAWLERPAWLAALAVSAAFAFTNVHNDIADLPGDRINHPDRSLPAGMVSLAEAWSLAIFCLVSSLLLGFWVNGGVLLFVGGLLLLAGAYNAGLSKLPVAGKVSAAGWLASTLAGGYLAAPAGRFPWTPFLATFFFILAREFLETISDDPGDRRLGRRTIYALWGKTRVLQLCLGLVVLAALILLEPLFSGAVVYPGWYLSSLILLLFLPVAGTGLVIWRDRRPANIRRAAYGVGLVFFTGPVAFFVVGLSNPVES